ncbi:thioredoxin domain-containing protein, partial [Streptomyces gardneri]
MVDACRHASVTDADFAAEVLGAELPVLVKFTAEWCG